MDIATVAGVVAGIICVVISINLDGDLSAFYDLPSIFITVGGGLCSTLISYRISEFVKIFKVVGKVFFGKQAEAQKILRTLVSLSQKSRREGLLALESEFEEIDDEFMKQSLQLIIDGVEPEMIKETMDLELENLSLRHSKGQGLFKTMGALFPAWGMIGTLIGLINLLKRLDDPSAIGPSMAVALITTFYGSMLANFVCIPIANKLGVASRDEIQMKQMILEGVLSIQAGENTRLMEHKLKTFLSPDEKRKYETESNEASSESKPVEESNSAIAG